MLTSRIRIKVRKLIRLQIKLIQIQHTGSYKMLPIIRHYVSGGTYSLVQSSNSSNSRADKAKLFGTVGQPYATFCIIHSG